jgi:hypothetical protein
MLEDVHSCAGLAPGQLLLPQGFASANPITLTINVNSPSSLRLVQVGGCCSWRPGQGRLAAGCSLLRRARLPPLRPSQLLPSD